MRACYCIDPPHRFLLLRDGGARGVCDRVRQYVIRQSAAPSRVMKYPPDPRLYPVAIDARFASLMERAQASLMASSRNEADVMDRATVQALAALLRSDSNT